MKERNERAPSDSELHASAEQNRQTQRERDKAAGRDPNNPSQINPGGATPSTTTTPGSTGTPDGGLGGSGSGQGSGSGGAGSRGGSPGTGTGKQD